MCLSRNLRRIDHFIFFTNKPLQTKISWHELLIFNGSASNLLLHITGCIHIFLLSSFFRNDEITFTISIIHSYDLEISHQINFGIVQKSKHASGSRIRKQILKSLSLHPHFQVFLNSTLISERTKIALGSYYFNQLERNQPGNQFCKSIKKDVIKHMELKYFLNRVSY